MAGIGDLVDELGAAAGSLFTSKGNAAEAASYTGAAQLEEQNAQLTATSTRIQASQTARAVTQSLGTTQADVAGAGFTESGSALDLLRSSAQQGSLATSLVNIQGAINENAYAAMAGADLAKAKAANEANTASTIQAIASVGGALINNAGQLASAGKTVVNGADAIITNPGDFLAGSYGVSGSTGVFVDAAGNSVAAGTPGAIQLTADQATSLAETGVMPTLDAGVSATDTAISSSVAVDTSAPDILGASTDAVNTGIGDFLSGAAVDVATGVGDAVSAAAAVAAGVGDAVAGAASAIGDAALAALAC